jgi:hypothetical protein
MMLYFGRSRRCPQCPLTRRAQFATRTAASSLTHEHPSGSRRQPLALTSPGDAATCIPSDNHKPSGRGFRLDATAHASGMTTDQPPP